MFGCTRLGSIKGDLQNINELIFGKLGIFKAKDYLETVLYDLRFLRQWLWRDPILEALI